MVKKDQSIFFIQILCALLIVNYHTSILDIPYLNSIAKGGFVLNTDFVFLSGYLLSLSFSKSNGSNFFFFIKKRLRRIYPSFIIVLIITFVYCLIASKEVLALNYLKWFTGFGYFFSDNEIFSNSHLWFVSVILVCYILFIPSYRLLEKRPFLLFTILTSIILLYNYYFTLDPYQFYSNITGYKILRLIYHYLIFLIAIYRQQKNINIKTSSYKRILIFISCYIGYVYFKDSSVYSGLALIFVLGVTLSFIPILYNLSSFVQNKIPILFQLSSIPYELYLIHNLVIFALNDYYHGNILAYPLTFIISIPLAFLINRISSTTTEVLARITQVPKLSDSFKGQSRWVERSHPFIPISILSLLRIHIRR